MRQREHFGHMSVRLKKYKFEGGRLFAERQFYGRAEFLPARCLYSQMGVASPETLEIFTHAGTGLCGSTPVEYEGEFYIISHTALCENRLYSTAKAGRAVKILCVADIEDIQLDEFRRPVRVPRGVQSYDGFWLERYDGNTTETEGHGSTAQRMVLLLPKCADYPAGTVFRIDETAYIVTKRYMTGRHWNEYEIIREADR